MSTNLDFSQVIQRAYDEVANRIRVDAELSASIIAPPGLEVSISAVDDNIAIRNSTNSNELKINNDGSIDVANVINVVSSTATLTNITSSISSQTVLAANSGRKGFILHNDSTANCFIALAATTTTSSFSIKLNSGMTYQNEAIIYTGVISALWDSANGFLRVTELS